MPRYPKPEPERRNRVAPVFDWVNLPAEGRDGDPPPLPAWRMWNPQTVEWWADLWSKPQAVMWDPSGTTLHKLAVLMDDLIANRTEAVKISPEARQLEDRHGLNPKAMLQLRWRIVADEVADARETKPKAPAKRRLRAIDPTG